MMSPLVFFIETIDAIEGGGKWMGRMERMETDITEERDITDGKDITDGTDRTDGTDGTDGTEGTEGMDGMDGVIDFFYLGKVWGVMCFFSILASAKCCE